MTLQNRVYFNNIRNLNLQEAKVKKLTVLFKTDEQMMERTYERDLKLKFEELYNSTNYIKKGNFKGFEVVFKGDKKDLEEVVDYITKTLDIKNGIYDSHKIK